MKTHMRKIVESIKNTFSSLQNIVLLISCAVLDVLFLLAYGFLTIPITTRIQDFITVLGTTVSRSAYDSTLAISKTGGSLLSNSFASTNAGSYMLSIFFLHVLLFFAVFSLFSLFEGTIWWLSGKKKENYLERIVSFSKKTFTWIIVLGLFEGVELAYDAMNVGQNVKAETNWLFSLVFYLIFLLMFFSLSRKETKPKLFRWIMMKWKLVVPVSLIIAVLFYIVDVIVISSGLIIGSIVLFLILSLTRITLIEVIENVDR